MQPDDPASNDPESTQPPENSREWLRKEIEVILGQPIDPAIVEKRNRELQELARLSQKAVPELSGDEALRL
jgi:hypothetical protein